MQQLTATVAAVGSLLAMWLGGAHLLWICLATALLYPGFLTLPVGTIDFTAGRIVIMVALLRALLDRRATGAFRLNRIDVLVFSLFVWGTFALLVTEGAAVVIENRSGALVDTVFVYALARLVIRRRSDLVTVAKAAALIVLVMAVFGVLESYSGWSPYHPLRAYNVYSRNISSVAEMRHGFYRAVGASGNSIVFGMCFVLLLPLVLALRKERGQWRALGTAAVVAALFGTSSSMSSGPFMCMMIFLICAFLVYKPDLVRGLLVLCLVIVLAAEIGSNRHFYHLVGYLALGSSATWYRSRLLEVAVEHLPEYWALGYGFKDPGWGLLLDGRRYTDVCNHYILLAVRHGALATLLFIGMVVEAVRRLRKAYMASYPSGFSDIVWFAGSMIVGIGMGLYSVALLDASQLLFYAMLGVIAGGTFEVGGRPGVVRVAGKAPVTGRPTAGARGGRRR